MDKTSQHVAVGRGKFKFADTAQRPSGAHSAMMCNACISGAALTFVSSRQAALNTLAVRLWLGGVAEKARYFALPIDPAP